MSKRVAIYTRVSTDQQTVENQRRELDAMAERMGWIIVERLADEGISGAKGREKRPAYDRLMTMVARKEIDLIACWSVDRLGRSLQHLVTFLGEINSRGVDLYLHTQGLRHLNPGWPGDVQHAFCLQRIRESDPPRPHHGRAGTIHEEVWPTVAGR
jgi:DNA invertase Pin-like site-specific DNA recombinase